MASRQDDHARIQGKRMTKYIKSTRNRRACMTRLMDLKEAKEQGYRSKRILALVPKRRLSSDNSSDDSADEESSFFRKNLTKPFKVIQPSDEDSSPAPSICSSLLNLNISNSDCEINKSSSPVIDVSSSIEHHITTKSVENVECEPIIQEPGTPQELTQLPTPSAPPRLVKSKRKIAVLDRPSNQATKAKKQKIVPISYNWKEKMKIDFNVDIPDSDLTAPPKIEEPLQYFQKFFSDDIIQLIVDQTNLYAVQKTGSSPNITANDIKDFLSINILMGVVQMPAYTDYWAKETRFAKVADVMSLKKFQKIRRFLHFSDNNEDNGDRYYKIRPLLIKIRQNCLSIEQEGRYSIDEMMVPYKGTRAGNRRQYMKGKPKKWGFKLFVRAGVSGLVYDFIVYGGEDTFRFNEFTPTENAMGFGAKIVLALAKSIRNPALSVLYFDNFFCSLDLITYLRENYGVLSLGTIRSNRLRGAQKILKSDKYLKKKGRGSYSQIVSTKRKVVIVKWYDNKAVHLASSFVGSLPLETVLRYDKAVKGRTRFECPQLIKQYNAHMGGVDLADMLVALYRTEFKGHRWYLPLFSQMLDICINNAWLLYRRDHNLLHEKHGLKLKAFRIALANSLAAAGRDTIQPKEFKSPKINTPSGPLPNDIIRYDGIGHWPAVEKKGRCRFCKGGQTTIVCQKCKIRLCLRDTRNCSEAFHTKV